MLLTLLEIKAKVDDLAETIGASQDSLPTYGYSNQSGHPHIDIGSQGYYYLVLERDTVCDRLITKDIDELLYKIFADVTFSLSIKFEAANRNYNQDFRRIVFNHQIELLALLSPLWANRRAREQAQILETSPFNDNK
jgi:hypothetical protein